MKKRRFILTAVLCSSIIGAAAMAQSSRSGEAISRQVVSIKNMLDSFANNIRPRLTAIETEVGNLIDRENERTGCFNVSGDSSVYWPTHPSAGSDGCVSHTELTETTTITGGCTNETLSWTVGGNTCSGSAPPTPGNVAYTFNYNTAATPSCTRRDTAGIRGQATFTCIDGAFVQDTDQTTICETVRRTHPDWGGQCR